MVRMVQQVPEEKVRLLCEDLLKCALREHWRF